MKDLFGKAKISTGSYRVRFHILRKFLTDNLAKVCAGDKWKTFVGKKTNTPYVGSEGRENCAKVLPFTNVNGRKAKVNSQELDDLRKALRHLESENRMQKTY
jgi:hypothetical protein